MQPSIPLYVDKIFDGGFRAMTINGSKILYNLNQIDNKEFEFYTDILNEYNVANIYLPAGRFIALISATLEENQANMMLLDLRDEQKFIEIAMDGVRNVTKNNKEELERFVAAVQKIKYKEEYNRFTLIEGNP